ncbi:MAG: peptide ABC transporter substrate-binding protein [Acetobacteraceae bacterium]|nr:peptide ABC transporter substrate-binding protein [Acetobacteraceae bacterium]
MGRGDEGTVVIGVTQEPDNLLLAFTPLYASGLVLATLYTRPVQYGDDWRPFPTWVERIPSVSGGDWEVFPDGRMRLTYRIRPGVRWHDGHPLQAYDVEWTWRMWTHPAVKSVVTKSDDVKVAGMHCPDPLTLVVDWSEMTPNANMCHRALPRHLLAEAFDRDPTSLPRLPFARSPVGMGPFRFSRWVPGEFIEVVRMAPPPPPARGRAAERIVFRFYPGPEELVAGWRRGEVDVVSGASMSLDEVLDLEDAFPEFRFVYKPALIVERLDFNCDSPALSDPRARLGLALAVDREELVRQASAGRLQVATSWLPTGHPDHDPVLRALGRDPGRARSLLLEAGWEERSGRLIPAGKSPLRLLTTAGDKLRERLAEGLVSAWREIGVACETGWVPARELFTELLPRRRFEHLAMYSWVMHLHAMGFGAWHSSQVPSPQNAWQGRNYPGWRSAENDALLSRGLRELDDDRRAAVMREQQAVFARDLPCLPLLMRAEVVAHRRGLKGIRPTGMSVGPVTWNAQEWVWSEEPREG